MANRDRNQLLLGMEQTPGECFAALQDIIQKAQQKQDELKNVDTNQYLASLKQKIKHLQQPQPAVGNTGSQSVSTYSA